MKKILLITSYLAIAIGIIMIVGGVWGISFTRENVERENITTGEDASIPNELVSGPFTLKAQADLIRMHTLKSTGGKTFAEMPRQIAKLDANGNPVLDEQGKPVMVANTARDMWITATTLTTALNLGIVTYAFSILALLFGIISVLTGVAFCFLSRKY